MTSSSQLKKGRGIKLKLLFSKKKQKKHESQLRTKMKEPTLQPESPNYTRIHILSYSTFQTIPYSIFTQPDCPITKPNEYPIFPFLQHKNTSHLIHCYKYSSFQYKSSYIIKPFYFISTRQKKKSNMQYTLMIVARPIYRYYVTQSTPQNEGTKLACSSQNSFLMPAKRRRSNNVPPCSLPFISACNGKCL